MLAIRDSDVEELLAWFEQCYDVEIHPMTGHAFWRRVVMPAAGGIGDQDARLINGLAILADVQQTVMDENAARRVRETQQEEQRRRNG